MKKCNVCGNKLPEWMFKTSKKKTCKHCEFKWHQRLLRFLVQDRRQSPAEKLAVRVGYMGVGFLIAGQWTINPVLYIFGFLCVLVQVSIRRQWNLVALQLNGLIAWTIHFLKELNIF